MNQAVVQQLLPLALAFIMFYLGLTLVLADFRCVVQRPKALLVGLTGQMLPVLLGMVLRWKFPQQVARWVPAASKVATSLFVLIVLATFWDQRQVLADHLPAMSAPSVVYALLMIGGAIVFVLLMRRRRALEASAV